MPLPKPPKQLNGHCSVINDNTLYVYQPDAFQKLDLRTGGNWTVLTNGASVTGGQCVKAVPNGDASQAALFIVGGNNGPSNYPGLQKYTFSSQKWEWVEPTVPVTANRVNHGATFLNQSNSIAVYAGSQQAGDNTPSSQTFLIQLNSNNNVLSFSSIGQPPAVNPMLMPFNESHAAFIGGDSTNKKVFMFGPSGWSDLGAQLSNPLTDQSKVQCTIVSGDDGSKVLETYDMGVSPNTVSRVALLNAGGSVAAPGTVVGGSPSRKRKRNLVERDNLSIDNWPAYNSSLAPKATRSGYSIAQDSTGRAVINGGSDVDPLCIFDQRQNAWLNATKLLVGDQEPLIVTPASVSSSIISSIPASTTLPTATSTSTPLPPTTPANSGRSKMLTVLGATLGAIFGIAAILIIILLLLRWKREKRKRSGDKDYIEKDADRLSFADRGADFMREAGGSAANSTPASRNHSNTSLNIIAGRFANPNRGSGHVRNGGPIGSQASTAGLIQKNKSPLGYNEPMEMGMISEKSMPVASVVPVVEKPVARTEPPPPPTTTNAAPMTADIEQARRHSSGWSRYFANNEATNLATMPSAGRGTYASDDSRNSSNPSESHYTDSRILSSHQTPSQYTIQPLDLSYSKFGIEIPGQRLSQVARASPTLTQSTENLPMQAQLSRANSTSHSSISTLGEGEGTFDSMESNTRTATTWTPVSQRGYDMRPPSAAPSSDYTGSVRQSEGPFKSGVPSSYYPNDGTSSYYPPSTGTGLTGKFVPPLRLGEKAAEGRDSTVTVFPRGVPSMQPPPTTNGFKQAQDQAQGRGQQGDMSWLNLGANH